VLKAVRLLKDAFQFLVGLHGSSSEVGVFRASRDTHKAKQKKKNGEARSTVASS
jgi:hypothetical protein